MGKLAPLLYCYKNTNGSLTSFEEEINHPQMEVAGRTAVLLLLGLDVKVGGLLATAPVE